MADLAYTLGAILPATGLLALAYLLTQWWRSAYLKSAVLSVLALFAAIFLHALGMADGGPLNFSAAGPAIAAQAVVFVADLIRISRRRPASV